MWTPCGPGVAFCTSTITATPEAVGVTWAFPVSCDPLRGSSVATAIAGGGPAGAAAIPPSVPASAPMPASADGMAPASAPAMPPSAPDAAVPPDGAVDDDAVAQAQAIATSKDAKRMGPPRFGRRNLAGLSALSTGSTHEREPARRSRMIAAHRRVIRLLQRADHRRPPPRADGAEVDLPQ